MHARRALLLLLVTACHPDHREHLTLYSPHGRDQLQLLEHAFEAANPDIDVRWLDMGSEDILDRLRFEKPNPVADVWFGGPTTLFDTGIADSLIEPYRPVWWRSVDSDGVGPDDMYWPVYRTPAVIAYNTNLVTAADAPHDWDDVLQPRWRDQVLIRDPIASGTMRAIWGMIIMRSLAATGDTAQGMAWLRTLDAQTRTYTLNPAILAEKLARGEGKVTLWDLPDLMIWRAQGMPFGYVFPTSGAPVIDDAIAIVRGHQASSRGRAVRGLCREHARPDSHRAAKLAPAGAHGRAGGQRPGLGRRCRRPSGHRPHGLAAAGPERERVDAILGSTGAGDRTREWCAMSTVRIERVAKQFDDTPVVADVSLDVGEGELLALLGPSGSGKTTLLRLIAGFESVDAGRIVLDGDDVTTRSAAERRCGMVFQHYALFPHLTVGANVRYGLAGSGLDRVEQAARVDEVLALVDLAGFQSRDVAALSGGQQQRVALARALAPRPRVLLLDEPLSNLDPSLRERTRQELRELLLRARITTILVTHEQEEAFDLAHRVAVLHLGRVEQIDTPERLYQAPATRFVASFVGRVTELSGQVVEVVAAGLRVRAGGGEWIAAGDPALRGRVTLAVRPDAARLTPDGPMAGNVTHRRFAGATTFYRIALADGGALEVAAAADVAGVGDEVRLAPTGGGAFAWPEHRA